MCVWLLVQFARQGVNLAVQIHGARSTLGGDGMSIEFYARVVAAEMSRCIETILRAWRSQCASDVEAHVLLGRNVVHARAFAVNGPFFCGCEFAKRCLWGSVFFNTLLRLRR